MRRTASALILAGALIMPNLVFAFDCESPVKHAERNARHLEELLGEAGDEKRLRVQSFIDDAEKLMAQAKKDCEAAASSLDEASAAAKALVAQGNLAAAQLLLKAD